MHCSSSSHFTLWLCRPLKTTPISLPGPLVLPAAINFRKFIEAQQNVDLLRAILVSTGVTIGAELVTLLIAFPAAYAVARIQTRLSTIVEVYIQPRIS